MLNIGSQSPGSYDPYVKFNGKAGRWYVKGEDGNEKEITPTSFVADFANIKTGWIMFVAGQAPSKVWDENISTPAAKPSDGHKRGFSLRLFSPNTFGGVVELSSSSMHICAAINEVYTAYANDVQNNKGMLPVVKYTGSAPQKDPKGTNYKPNFVIEKWVARPAELESEYEQSAPVAVAKAVAPPVTNSVSEF